MASRKKDALRELLDRELSDLTTDAADPDFVLTGERFDGLRRLSQLIAIRESARPKVRNWLSALVVLGTLAVVTVLLFARVGETDIELEVNAAELAFDIPKDQVLTDAMNLAAIGASGLRAVDLPALLAFKPRPGNPSDRHEVSVVLGAATSGSSRGTLTLAPVRVAAGKRLSFQRSSRPNGYRVSIDGRGLMLQAALSGTVSVGLSGAVAQTQTLASPQQIMLSGGAEDLDLDLEFESLPQRPLAAQLEVRNLSFGRIDQYLGTDRTMLSRVSTVLGGTLFFEALDGKERRLRAGEELRFGMSLGNVRALELQQDAIALKFHGRVREMTIGTGDNQRSLMPTYLEWLQARHALSLLWGTSLYLVGLVAGVLRWWGLRP